MCQGYTLVFGFVHSPILVVGITLYLCLVDVVKVFVKAQGFIWNKGFLLGSFFVQSGLVFALV